LLNAPQKKASSITLGGNNENPLSYMSILDAPEKYKVQSLTPVAASLEAASPLQLASPDPIDIPGAPKAVKPAFTVTEIEKPLSPNPENEPTAPALEQATSIVDTDKTKARVILFYT
jgi:hypothetical protein